MYRRAVRDAIGDYDVNTYCAEDYDYWLRVLQTFDMIMPIDRILYRYRRHRESLSETKRKQVSDQLTKLRVRYIDKILNIFKEDRREVCRIYYEMRKSQYMTTDIRDKFREVVPELADEVPIEGNKKYIIFGAGVYGERAARDLGRMAAFFADSDPSKEGIMKEGIEVLAFQRAIGISAEYGAVIAVSGKRIYEMIRQLTEAGIKKYCLYLG